MTDSPTKRTGALFGTRVPAARSLRSYESRRPRHLNFDRIFLAKGSLDTNERRRIAEGVCALYPEAERIERLDAPHNRIDLGEADALARHRAGKRTLVLGVHGSSVRRSEESGNTCPNYWHFSPYGFCPYACAYCYLAGTTGVWHSPTVKIYVNLPEILAGIDRVARRLAKPTAFYLGKLQDGLALDPLTGYSKALVPFFAQHPFAMQVILTKSAGVDNLIGLGHGGRTILSWSVNPPEVAGRFEVGSPSMDDRLGAMERCAAAGYPVRAVLMPMIPLEGWPDIYWRFVGGLLARVPIRRLTVGGICSYRNARRLMERKLGRDNPISRSFEAGGKAPDGRLRYPRELRVEMYRRVIGAARQVRPETELALCLEERPVWEAVGLAGSLGRCNCVL